MSGERRGKTDRDTSVGCDRDIAEGSLRPDPRHPLYRKITVGSSVYTRYQKDLPKRPAGSDRLEISYSWRNEEGVEISEEQLRRRVSNDLNAYYGDRGSEK